MPADLIIYAVVAAGLVLWLKGTIGTRQEGDDTSKPAKLPNLDTIAPLDNEVPKLALDQKLSPKQQIQDIAEDKSGILAIEDERAENGLLSIMAADKTFDLKFFLNAVQDAFVLIVESFAEGDKDILEDMLEPSVYKAFESAIDDRSGRGEVAETQIQSIIEAHIIEARMDKKTALITVRFLADETTVVKNTEGEIIEGHPERSSRMKDIWTFGRDIKSRDPRWFVYETRGDFEGDNDQIPNA